MHFWKISDFTEEIKKVLELKNLHMNTVDGWFKRLETDGIHYVNRAEETKEKIYDELDLKIAIFIKKRREEKWALTAILNDLNHYIELRPFPVVKERAILYEEDLAVIKNQWTEEMKGVFEEMATVKLEDLKSQYESMMKQLSKPLSIEEVKENRFQEMVLRRRIENELEDEAIKMWTTKPEAERLKRVGLFKKEEDFAKRALFIKNYLNEHFEKKVREELHVSPEEGAISNTRRIL
jgi:hypothetical protein